MHLLFSHLLFSHLLFSHFLPATRRLPALALFAALMAPLTARSDVVTLKSGERIEGFVVEDSPVVVSIKRGGEVLLYKPGEVSNVEFTPEGDGHSFHLGKGRHAKASAPEPTMAPASERAVASSRGAQPKAQPSPSVTIYGTSWCGYCKRAREYFRSQGIPFADLDIEQDAVARNEVAMKCLQAGTTFTGGVPVIDVNGAIIKGFDVRQIKNALQRRGG